MILFTIKDFKSDFQKSYDNAIHSIQIHQVSCPHCNHYNLIQHGIYERGILTDEEKIQLKVSRVKCQFCSKTHALLPVQLVPYQQIPLETQLDVIKDSLSEEKLAPSLEKHPFVDEFSAKMILLRFYTFWMERLKSLSIQISPIDTLIKSCVSHYHLQFMQIRKVPISLFVLPT